MLEFYYLTDRCWKKQLAIAKDARRVDVLCYRIFLSYRLLDGTSRFKELHEITTEAKTKLEAEVGPMNGESVKMARGIVSRLSVAGDVQKLCSQAIEKADEWLANASSESPNCAGEKLYTFLYRFLFSLAVLFRSYFDELLTSFGIILAVDSLPAACRFLFEEVSSSSLAVVLVEIPTPFTDQIKGYKMWYCQSRNEDFSVEPSSIFPREKRRIVVKSLQPCTEYTFRIVSYTEAGDLGHSEAKCFTKSVEIINKNPSPAGPMKENPCVEGSSSDAKEQPSPNPVENSGFKVRDLGKILRLAWAQEQGSLEGFCCADTEHCCGVTKHEATKDHQSSPVSRELDLNVASVPDLNEDLTPPNESSRDEDNGCSLERANGADDDAASNGIEKNGLARSNGSGPSDNSQACTLTRNGDVPAVDSLVESRQKRAFSSANDEAHDSDSALITDSPLHVSSGPGSLDGNFEYCVKVIRTLECQGYIKQDFRLKLLTWFSLRSTEQERRVVSTFIQTLADDPKSLAGQLVDSFGDIISCKKPRNSLTSKFASVILNDIVGHISCFS